MDYGLQTFGRETDFEKYQYISSITKKFVRPKKRLDLNFKII